MSEAVTLPTLKRGDTFLLSCTSYHKVGKTKVFDDLTDVSIRSQIRLNDRFIAELNVAKADQVLYPGEFSLRCEADITKKFSADRYQVDIEQTVNGVVTSSDMMFLPVVLDVTHD